MQAHSSSTRMLNQREIESLVSRFVHRAPKWIISRKQTCYVISSSSNTLLYTLFYFFVSFCNVWVLSSQHSWFKITHIQQGVRIVFEKPRMSRCSRVLVQGRVPKRRHGVVRPPSRLAWYWSRPGRETPVSGAPSAAWRRAVLPARLRRDITIH